MGRRIDPRLASRRVGWIVRRAYGRTRLFGLWWPVSLEKEIPFYAFHEAGATKQNPRDGIMYADRFGTRAGSQALRQLSHVILCDAFDWSTAKRLVDPFAGRFLSGRGRSFILLAENVKGWEREFRAAMEREAAGNSYVDNAFGRGGFGIGR